jgi:hypothetical protein
LRSLIKMSTTDRARTCACAYACVVSCACARVPVQVCAKVRGLSSNLFVHFDVCLFAFISGRSYEQTMRFSGYGLGALVTHDHATHTR